MAIQDTCIAVSAVAVHTVHAIALPCVLVHANEIVAATNRVITYICIKSGIHASTRMSMTTNGSQRLTVHVYVIRFVHR